jgi:hypothetical protein
MPLKAVVENIEDLSEPLREYYTKGDDGKFHLSAEGVEDVSGLKSALGKERSRAGEAEKALKAFEGWTLDDLKELGELRNRLEKDEDFKLIKEGKHEEVFTKRLEKMRAEHDKQIEKLTATMKTEIDAANKRTQMYEGRVMENALRQAATEVGIHPQAVRDALFQGRTVFVLDENGNAVQKREDGSLVIGKDGKSPFTPKEWLESMRAEAPHWFPAAGNGTGAPQSGRTNATGQKQMTRSDFARLNPSQQHAFIRKEGGVLID